MVWEPSQLQEMEESLGSSNGRITVVGGTQGLPGTICRGLPTFTKQENKIKPFANCSEERQD